MTGEVLDPPDHRAVARVFGVTQKPRYLPSARRVCASSPGKALKKIILTGTKIHCSASTMYRKRLRSSGRFGRSVSDMYDETTSPSIARMSMLRTTRGKLYESTVS